uniref:hypothetical protein n=1 Tax=Stieleria sp. TaxID=2795976 RepID=UPI00356B2270
PILPGSGPPPAPQMPIDITPPIEEEKPAPAPVPVPIETLDLVLHYDKKQLLEFAVQHPDVETPLPGPVSLRGYVRLKPIPDDTDNAPDIKRTKLVVWGGSPQSLGAAEELVVVTTQLTERAQTLTVEQLPSVPEPLGPTKVYWSRQTGDLIAIADLDLSSENGWFSEQGRAYQTAAVKLARFADLADSIERESVALPPNLKEVTEAFFRHLFPGKAQARIESLIRRAGGVDLSEASTKLKASLRSKLESSNKALKKDQQAALVQIVDDCGQLAQVAAELHAAFAVLAEGHRVEVPELKFLESETVVLRRVPLHIHFSW